MSDQDDHQLIPFDELPDRIRVTAAVDAAYPEELQRAADALVRGLPVLVECSKGLAPLFYRSVRERLRARDLGCVYLDGRVPPDAAGPGMPQTIMTTMINQVRDVVRGSQEPQVAVLPHLDLLTTSDGGLTGEAREVISLMYENPTLRWLGFRDPSFRLPRVIADLFPYKVPIVGVARGRLQHLVTKREARKLGRDGLDVYRLYRSVSGAHAVRLRRILTSIEGEDFPVNEQPAWDQIRAATVASGMDIPTLDLDADIGGYVPVKTRIRDEIITIIKHLETLTEASDVERIESLLPRGMIFWGPPGTGKTLFAKALASALGAAVQVVSGPELKSRWVGQSEENLRRVFMQARQSAPSLIIFDELDSFAAARGTYTGSGVEHSMVNQLLTEMDGFRSNEMVFVVGTTNFPESLDPALLRPGRFEFKIHIPYPDEDDRGAIIDVYDARLKLELTPETREHMVRQSGYPTEDGVRWSGDHIRALCRGLARRKLRGEVKDALTPLDVDAVIDADRERPELTKAELKVIATHECGHAIVALHCDNVPPIRRISIRGDLAGALGFVEHVDPANRYVFTEGQLRDMICVLFGGREAEAEVLGALSAGAQNDLQRATMLARAAITQYGMGPTDFPVQDFAVDHLSEASRGRIDDAVEALLAEQRQRARTIITEHRGELDALNALLLEKQVLLPQDITVTPKA